ncbi:amidohydrolase family protein [Nitrincola alkalisediminis]|uniref:amidohydrolase family protein n=1 Tax=Nitrincola alkalisediminis TaxID=1366656 RepID=UPI0018771810|nr:amidohydrolase family protein [Nitrincola alkalisediminis]
MWLKLSAPYRSPVIDLKPYTHALLAYLGSDRLVWGSDWPWTRHEQKHTYAETLKWLSSWVADPAEAFRVLEESPKALYRLS